MKPFRSSTHQSTSSPLTQFPALTPLASQEQDEDASAEKSNQTPSHSASYLAGTVGVLGRSRSLYETFVASPVPMYYEMLEDPKRFDPAAVELVQLLVYGQKSQKTLTLEELLTLDYATLAWASPRHPRPLGGDERAPASLEPQEPEESNEEEEEGLDVPSLPDDAPPTFWWRASSSDRETND